MTAQQQHPVIAWYAGTDLEVATPARRLSAYLIDWYAPLIVLLFAVIPALAIGELFGAVALLVTATVWIVWFVLSARNSQTPGKQLLGLYILREDGSRAGFGYTIVREFLVKGILFALVSGITGGIGWVVSAAWCLWDNDRQCLWDKVLGTYIARSPSKYPPPTSPAHMPD